jgi:hypothetical protein
VVRQVSDLAQVGQLRPARFGCLSERQLPAVSASNAAIPLPARSRPSDRSERAKMAASDLEADLRSSAFRPLETVAAAEPGQPCERSRGKGSGPFPGTCKKCRSMP